MAKSKERKAAEAAARKITADLAGRRGLRQAWDEIDPRTKSDMFFTWRVIIELAIRDASGA